MWRDLKSAYRNVVASRVYAATAVVTLALAVAANACIFGLVYTILLRPLPIADPDRVVVMWESDVVRGQPVMELTYRQFEGWRSAAASFERLAAIGSAAWPMVLEGRGDPVRLNSAGVSTGFFEILGARPALGRVFDAGDETEARGSVVIMSHGAWVRRFGRDAGIVGRSLTLDGRPHTVVGVMPRDFDFPRGTELWTPVLPVLRRSAAEWKTDVVANVGVLHAIGRLRPGVTLDAARAEMTGVVRRFPYYANQPNVPVLTPLLDLTLGAVRDGLWWLLASVGVLLLVACANVSSLTLARASARMREHGIRLALGATRLRLGRMWLAEAALLGAAGGGLGLAAAVPLLRAIVAVAPDDIPRIRDAGIGWPEATFTLLVTMLAVVLCAAVVIAYGSSAGAAQLLNDGAHATASRRSNRLRSTLVVAQMALAVVLLTAAALVVRSFSALQRLDVGFDAANVLTLGVQQAAEMPPHVWFDRAVEAVEVLPNVDAAGAVLLRPLAYGAIGWDTTMLYEGQGGTFEKAVADGAKNPKLNLQVATPGYFRAMRIPLLRGRFFDERDRAGTQRVAVLGETAAARLWPGQDPIGKRFTTPENDKGVWREAWRTVIGVVKDVHYRGVNDVRNDMYEPAAQSVHSPGFLVIRTAADPLTIAAAVQARIRSHDPRAVISGITTMEAVLARELAPWRLSSWMLAVLATMTFTLAIVGLAGLLALEVAQRVREFAVRIALGADGRSLQAHVLRSAALRAAVGLCAGVACALAATRWLRALLFDVSAADPATYAGVCAAVAVTVTIVSMVPAARAGRVDPIEILKRE